MSAEFKRGRLAIAVNVGLLAATTVGAWPMVTFAAPASVQHSGLRSFDIAGGSLAEVLSRFASAAGAALSFDAKQTDGLHSAGLKGAFGISEGFSQILAGSGLQAEPQANGTYVLRAVPSSGSALELGATREEIAAVLQLTSVLGIHTMSLAAPILEEELAHAHIRSGAASHAVPTN